MERSKKITIITFTMYTHPRLEVSMIFKASSIQAT